MISYIKSKLQPIPAEVLSVQLRDYTKRELVIAETALENALATRDMLQARIVRLNNEIIQVGNK